VESDGLLFPYPRTEENATERLEINFEDSRGRDLLFHKLVKSQSLRSPAPKEKGGGVEKEGKAP